MLQIAIATWSELDIILVKSIVRLDIANYSSFSSKRQMLEPILTTKDLEDCAKRVGSFRHSNHDRATSALLSFE